MRLIYTISLGLLKVWEAVFDGCFVNEADADAYADLELFNDDDTGSFLLFEMTYLGFYFSFSLSFCSLIFLDLSDYFYLSLIDCLYFSTGI